MILDAQRAGADKPAEKAGAVVEKSFNQSHERYTLTGLPDGSLTVPH
jgi:hypothetical protein